MVDKLSIEIALEGGEEVERQLADIGEAGKKAFSDLSSAADGGSLNVLATSFQKAEEAAKSFAEATKSIAALGGNAKEALEATAAAAQKFGASTQEIQKVESAINALGARARDGSLSFTELATNYDKARSSAAQVTPAVTDLAASFAGVGTAVTVVVGAIAVLGAAMLGMAKTAASAAEGIRQVRDIAGGTGESIASAVLAFESFGASARSVEQAITGMAQRSIESMATLAREMETSGEKAGNAATKLKDLEIQASQLRLKQIETEVARRKELYNEEISDASKANLKLEQLRLRQLELDQQRTDNQKQQGDARRALLQAEANDIGALVAKLEQLGAISFDNLTEFSSILKAIQVELNKISDPTEKLKRFLQIFDQMSDRALAFAIASKLGFGELVKLLGEGESALKRFEDRQRRIAEVGLGLNASDLENLRLFSLAWDRLTSSLTAALIKLGALAAPVLTPVLNAIATEIENISKDLHTLAAELSAIGELGAAAWDAITRAILTAGSAAVSAWEAIKQGAADAGAAMLAFAAELPTIAWDAISSAGVAAWDAITAAIQRAIAALLQAIGLQGGAGAAPEPGGPSGVGHNASGGLIGGRGTGMSDSNLAWVSRGEHIMPARAVQQPGVLAFLEALRRSGGNLSAVLDGMGRFALGGMVPRAMPAFAAGGLAGGNNVTIQFPGLPAISGLRASSAVVDELRKAAALAQVRSGGRKPSRYS